jgi:hypothetical protein
VATKKTAAQIKKAKADEQKKTDAINAAAAMGVSAALLESMPELQAVKEALDAGSTAKALELLKQTNFYKNVDVKERRIQKLEQRGIYDNALEQYVLASRKRLVAQGINLDDKTLLDYAEQAYDLGFTDNQFDQMILKNSKAGKIGGGLEGQAYQLQSYANSFGVSKMFNASYWDQKKQDLFAGKTTTEDIQTDIRNTAASAYPTYAEQIQNGVSVDALASAYKSSIASILEIDPDSVTYDNQYLRRAMQNIGPDGKPAVKPLWQFEKELRSTNEWQYTNNARDSIDSMGLKVLRDWGLA